MSTGQEEPMTTTDTPTTEAEAVREMAKDATAELAHFADKYRDVPFDEQLDLLLIYAKSCAAETGSTSLTTSEIAWLSRSVRTVLRGLRVVREEGR